MKHKDTILKLILRLEKNYGATFNLRRYWNSVDKKFQWRFLNDNFIDGSLENCLKKALNET